MYTHGIDAAMTSMIEGVTLWMVYVEVELIINKYVNEDFF